MIKTVTDITVYEVEGRELSTPFTKPGPKFEVSSHSIRRELVRIKIGDDVDVTVTAEDLRAAISNAVNR